MLGKKKKNEKGSVLVYVALLVTVLLGIAALAVEYGFMLNERSILQNAVDAAALAAAVEADSENKLLVAKEYFLKNTSRADGAELAVDIIDCNTLKVTASKEVPAFFSCIFVGGSTNTVSASATAEFSFDIPKVDYAVWVKDGIALNSANEPRIDGNVHSAALSVKDEWMKRCLADGGRWDTGGELPDLSKLTRIAEEFSLESLPFADFGGEGLEYYIDGTAAAILDDDKVYYLKAEEGDSLNSTVVIKTAEPINIIAECAIRVEFSGDSAAPSLIYSTKSNIVLTGEVKNCSAVLCAPEGDVCIKALDGDMSREFRGMIIAKSFTGTGIPWGYRIIYDSTVLDKFAERRPRLIR